MNRDPLQPLETEKLKHSPLQPSFNAVEDTHTNPTHSCPAWYRKHCCVTSDPCNVQSSHYQRCDIYLEFVKPYARAYARIKKQKDDEERTRESAL